MSTSNFSANFSESKESNQFLSLNRINEIKAFTCAFVLPAICFVGIVTNSLNVIVFAKRKQLKNKIYKYFLAHSVIDLTYLLLTFSYFLLRYSLGERVASTYFVQVYELVTYFFLTSALAINLVLIELFISIKRLLIVHNITMPSRVRSGSALLICAFLAFASTAPILQAFIIKRLETDRAGGNRSDFYQLSFERVEKNARLRIVLGLPGLFRGLVFPIMLLIINIRLWTRFRQQLKKKSRLQRTTTESVPLQTSSSTPSDKSSESNASKTSDPVKAQRNLTRMIICVNFLFIATNATSFLSILSTLVFGRSSKITMLSSTASNTILFLSHSVSFFVYLAFDKLFNHIFKSIFTRSSKPPPQKPQET